MKKLERMPYQEEYDSAWEVAADVLHMDLAPRAMDHVDELDAAALFDWLVNLE
jgi:hypothetical protein